MLINNNVDIMFFIELAPIKRGSFEDFVINISNKLDRKNISSIFIFNRNINSQLNSYFKEMNVKYEVVDIKNHKFTNLIKFIIKYKPKICHFHFIKLSLRIALLCSLFKVKSYYTIHDSIPSNQSYKNNYIINKLKLLKRRIIINRIDKIICVSDFLKKWLKSQYNIPDNKLQTIHNGVYLKRFNNLNESIGNEILYIGQLIPEKGIHILIQAINEVLPRKEVYLTILGDGKYYEELVNLTQKLNLENYVKFEGLVEDVSLYFKKASLLICPSIWNEAFGLVLIEAMASRVPVIASRCGGIPEIITHGYTGILVPANDQKALTDAIDELFNNPILQENIRTTAYDNVQKNFDINHMVNNYMLLYDF